MVEYEIDPCKTVLWNYKRSSRAKQTSIYGVNCCESIFPRKQWHSIYSIFFDYGYPDRLRALDNFNSPRKPASVIIFCIHHLTRPIGLDDNPWLKPGTAIIAIAETTETKRTARHAIAVYRSGKSENTASKRILKLFDKTVRNSTAARIGRLLFPA